MDRRSFLKVLGSAILGLFLPKVKPVEEMKAIEEEDWDSVYLPRNPGQKTVEFLTSPEQFDWYYENVPWFSSMVRRSEEAADDPSTYPSFAEVNAKLVEISGFSLEPPDTSKWCVARLEGVTYTPVDNDELTDASDV